jgi:hypothetical protein
MLVTGVDANRDGIPDALQQQGLPPTAGGLQPGIVCSIKGVDQPPGCPPINGKTCKLVEFQRDKWIVDMQDGGGKVRLPARALIPMS